MILKRNLFSLSCLLINLWAIGAAPSSQQGVSEPTVQAGASLHKLALKALINNPAQLAKDLPALHTENDWFYDQRYTLPAKSINDALLARLAYDTQQLDVKTDRVTELVFSPDSRTVATWQRSDKTLNLSDLQTGKVLRTLPHGDEDVQSAAFSPNGTLLTTGDRKENNVWTGTARLWNPHTGELLRTFPSDEHPTTYISATAFNADGSLIALASTDNSNTIVSLWDPATGAVIRTFSHQGTVGALAFSPDNKVLAVESVDGLVLLWNVVTGKFLAHMHGDGGTYLSLTFSSDGSKLSAKSSFGAIKVWDLPTGTLLFNLQRTQDSSWSVTMSPDGNRVAALQDNTLRLWNTQTGELLHTGSIKGRGGSSISFSSDGKILASETMQNVQLWDTETGALIQVLPCDFIISGIQFSPDNTILAAFSERRYMRSTIRLWRIDYQKDLQTIKTIEEQQFLLYAAQDWLAGKPHIVLQETYPIYQNLILRFPYLDDERLFAIAETSAPTPAASTSMPITVVTAPLEPSSLSGSTEKTIKRFRNFFLSELDTKRKRLQ